MTTTATECSLCGNKLDSDELENPQLDRDDGDPICDECHHEKYEFTCCQCCNYGDVADQHNMLVVFEETPSSGGPTGATRTILPGVYRIKQGPYYGGPIIGGGYLFGDNLERIASVNPDMDGEGYPCGHLCLECQGHLLAQFTGRCSVCRQTTDSCLRVKLGSWKDFEAHKYQWTRFKNVCAACRHAHRGAWRR